MPSKLGSGDIQFQGCLLGPAKAICLCFHQPPHVPDRDNILAYLHRQGIDLSQDFSMVLDADGGQDVLLVFGNQKTLDTFKMLVNVLTGPANSVPATPATSETSVRGLVVMSALINFIDWLDSQEGFHSTEQERGELVKRFLDAHQTGENYFMQAEQIATH